MIKACRSNIIALGQHIFYKEIVNLVGADILPNKVPRVHYINKVESQWILEELGFDEVKRVWDGHLNKHKTNHISIAWLGEWLNKKEEDEEKQEKEQVPDPSLDVPYLHGQTAEVIQLKQRIQDLESC